MVPPMTHDSLMTHQPWQIGLSELQRQAILADPKFNNGDYPDDSPPNSGIAVARQIAMVSCRTHPRLIVHDSSMTHQ